MPNVSGFLPSQNGLHYINTWPKVPDVTLQTPLGPLGILEASNGLCGGMAYAVCDLFSAGCCPPAGANPAPQTPGFQYICNRFIESLELPGGVLKVYRWMSMSMLDRGFYPGVATRTVNEVLPAIRSAILADRLMPIKLIRVRSRDPRLLGVNHQVVVWGFEEQPPLTVLRIYDPNYLDRDDITITIERSADGRPAAFQASTGEPLVGLYPSEYAAKDPAPLFQ